MGFSLKPPSSQVKFYPTFPYTTRLVFTCFGKSLSHYPAVSHQRTGNQRLLYGSYIDGKRENRSVPSCFARFCFTIVASVNRVTIEKKIWQNIMILSCFL